MFISANAKSFSRVGLPSNATDSEQVRAHGAAVLLHAVHGHRRAVSPELGTTGGSSSACDLVVHLQSSQRSGEVPARHEESRSTHDPTLWRARAQCVTARRNTAVARARTCFSPSTWQRAHGAVHGQHMTRQSFMDEPSMPFISRIFPRAGARQRSALFTGHVKVVGLRPTPALGPFLPAGMHSCLRRAAAVVYTSRQEKEHANARSLARAVHPTSNAIKNTSARAHTQTHTHTLTCRADEADIRNRIQHTAPAACPPLVSRACHAVCWQLRHDLPEQTAWAAASHAAAWRAEAAKEPGLPCGHDDKIPHRV
jgi:hypothetical protein